MFYAMLKENGYLVGESDTVPVFDPTEILLMGDFRILGTAERLAIIELSPIQDFAANKYLFDGKDVVLIPPEKQEPVVAVPQTVTMRQARLALLAAGLLDTVDAAVASRGAAAKIEWEYATDVDRDWPLVVQLGTVLSLDIDALFLAAAEL